MTKRPECIEVRGARTNNLKDVDVDIPRGVLVAVTGVSGSGKSSLAFGTIFAEAQRRFLGAVAPYARRLIDQVTAADVRAVHGLPPAVAMRQRAGAPGPRSTVGTLTGTSALLRSLVSRAGTYPAGAARLDSDAFSASSVAGACRRCSGAGEVHEVTEQSLVPDPALTIRERAIAAWPGAWQGKNYRDILGVLGYPLDTPWRDIPQADRDWILMTDEQPVVTVHAVREAHRIQRPYEGTYSSPRRYVLTTIAKTASRAQRERALRFVETAPCPTCDGSGIREDALAVTYAGRSIAQLAELPMSRLVEVLGSVPAPAGARGAAAGQLVRAIVERGSTMARLGLGTLAASRRIDTVSTGEHQRLRLAAQAHADLFGVLYVFDEPAAGMHPADVEQVVAVLRDVCDSGNSVIVIEHDAAVVRASDVVVDIGPGAGARGGQVVFTGTPADLARSTTTTARFLDAPAHPIEPPAHSSACETRDRAMSGVIAVRGAAANNLRGVDVDVPVGRLTAVTGVSGAGKSTLLRAIHDAAGGDAAGSGGGRRRRVVWIDRTPIGRTPRSAVATYVGAFDGIRSTFASTDAAQDRGLGASAFSFNVTGGRCDQCEGAGIEEITVLAIPDSWTTCTACAGARYGPDVLGVTWRGMTIADVLSCSVDEAIEQLAGIGDAVERPIRVLGDLGLGYLRLGHPATDLSGGEAARVRLARDLQRVRQRGAVYVVDEPTSGLHPADVDVLAAQLVGLVDRGATVVVATHDMRLAAASDHVVDVGPGAGSDGGTIVAAGSPSSVAASPRSATATYLSRHVHVRGADG